MSQRNIGVFNGCASCFKVGNGFDDLRYAHILVGIVVLEHQQNTGMVLFGGDACIGQLNEIAAIAGDDDAIFGNRVRENRIISTAHEIDLAYRLHVMSGSR